jgi:effector-binding domain-containing protein
MLKIGDFSKLARVSIKALRYYDEIGLLKPVRIDQFTGYRYYETSQLPRLTRIIALKDMGLSLYEIARLLKENVSISHILDLLHIKQGELKERLEQEAARLTRVEEWLKQVEKEGKMPDYEIVLKKVPSQKVVAIRATLPGGYGETGRLFDKLMPYVFQSRAQMIGPPIEIIYDEDFKETDVDVEVAIPVASIVPAQGEIKSYELPGYDRMATTIHKGNFDTVSAAYAALMKWIEASGYQVAGPSREIYFTDPHSGVAPNEYVTEVQFPVEKAK